LLIPVRGAAGDFVKVVDFGIRDQQVAVLEQGEAAALAAALLRR
jgi:hypothetical protein